MGISRDEKCAVFCAGFQRRTEIQRKNTEHNTAEETLEIMGLMFLRFMSISNFGIAPLFCCLLHPNALHQHKTDIPFSCVARVPHASETILASLQSSATCIANLTRLRLADISLLLLLLFLLLL